MRNPIQLFKDAFSIFSQNIVLFLGILLVPVVFSFVTGLFAPTAAEQSVGIGFSPAYIVMALLSAIVNVFMSIAIILAIQNNALTVMESYKQSMPFFLRYIGLSIVMSVLLFLGFLILIIPGIILSVWFAFSSFVLVVERAGIIDSIKKSREYARGHWWAVFGRILLLGLAMLVISMIISGLSVAMPFGILATALVAAFTMLLAPFAVAYMYLMYQDLKGGSVVSNESST
jgi:hypothetical protein